MQILKNYYHFFQRFLAKYYLKLFPRVGIIGVTGSVGKTTTKEMIASVLSQKYQVIASKDNLDPIYNIPLTIFKLRPQAEKMVMELSVDHFGDMDKYFWMIKPNIGVFTPIYWTHTEYLKNLEGVITEKGKLAEVLPENGCLILNKDDPASKKIAKKTRAKIFYYGLTKECNLYAKDIITEKLEGAEFVLIEGDSKLKTSPALHGRENKEQGVKIKLKVLGRQNVYCALAAAAVGKICGLGFGEIKKGLEKNFFLPQRMNLIKLPNKAFLIDDSYNANPLGVKAALEAVKELNIKGKRIAVLGEMKELGAYSENGHREVGRTLIYNNFSVLIAFGEFSKFTADEVPKLNSKISIYQPKTIGEIISLVKKIVKRDDLILLKGSRFSHMERISLGLLAKKISCNKVTCKKYQPCVDCENIV